MKTLDEVIDDFEKACDLERRCEDCSGCLGQEAGCPNDGAESVPDALHYLKEYRMQLDDIVAKRKVLEYKTAQYELMCETVQKQGQEHEDRLQAEIARYMDAVKSCEQAENKYKMLSGKLEGFPTADNLNYQNSQKMVNKSDSLSDTENKPLTWEQLKQMEGKPVWVEALLYKQWAVIAYVGSDHIRFEGANLYAPESRVYMGDANGWQAYRKERADG